MTTPAAPADILGESRPLAKVFSSDYVFSIPTYQRPYAWTTEETEELLDDVLAFADRDPDRDAAQVHALPPYFLGSVVLIKAPNDPRADVVDGQQRLTTLSVLFAALRELADLGERQEFDPFVREAGSTVRGTKAQPRLTLRARDQPFFARHVQAPGALAGIADAKTENDAQENLRDNAALLYRRLAEMEPARRTRLGAYLAQRCYLVVVSTRDRPSAYRIFSVLNDRGLDLSAADILKADTIGALATDPDAEAEFTRRWEDTEETLGRDRFLELFGHIRTVHQKVKRKEALLDEVQKYVRPSERPRAFIEDELEPYADVLLQAREATFGNRTDPDPSVAAVNRALRHLGDVDNADWVPVALVLLRHHAADPERLAQALGLLDRLASAMMVYRGNVNARVERYAEALTHLEGDHVGEQPSWNGDPLAPDSPLHLRDDEHARVLDRLDGDLYEEKRTRKFVLLRLDEALSEGTATYDHGTVSVEHVLPQTPPAGSEWTRQFDGGGHAPRVPPQARQPRPPPRALGTARPATSPSPRRRPSTSRPTAAARPPSSPPASSKNPTGRPTSSSAARPTSSPPSPATGGSTSPAGATARATRTMTRPSTRPCSHTSPGPGRAPRDSSKSSTRVCWPPATWGATTSNHASPTTAPTAGASPTSRCNRPPPPSWRSSTSTPARSTSATGSPATCAASVATVPEASNSVSARTRTSPPPNRSSPRATPTPPDACRHLRRTASNETSSSA